MKKVSIIIPIFNIQKYLDRCIKSVLTQTYRNIQIILVNDGSTDNSGTICDYYAQRDDRIVVINKDNGGVSESRNFGLTYADGHYVTFIDGDDYVSRNYIEQMLSLIEQYKADIVISSWIYTKSLEACKNSKNVCFGHKIFNWNAEETLHYMLLNIYITGSVCGVLSKRSLWDELRFPVGKRHSEDVYVSSQLYCKTEKIVYTDEVLYYYFVRSGSTQNEGYSIAKMEELELIEASIKLVLQRYPELIDETTNKLISSCFHILFFMNYMESKSEEGRKIIGIIKRNRSKILTSRNVSTKVRIGCILSFFGFYFTKIIYNKLNMRGRINI